MQTHRAGQVDLTESTVHAPSVHDAMAVNARNLTRIYALGSVQVTGVDGDEGFGEGNFTALFESMELLGQESTLARLDALAEQVTS